MNLSPNETTDATAMIAAIAREVVRRLKAETATSPPRDVDHEQGSTHQLVTTDTVNSYPDGATIRLAARAVVTPAARDQAHARGIRWTGGSINQNIEISLPTVTVSASIRPGVHAAPNELGGNETDAESAAAIRQQLTRRGITLPTNLHIVWSSTPAADVVQHCGRGNIAVMLTRLADVERFAAEVSPTVWVIDRQQVNLVAATNMAARIARLPSNMHQMESHG